MRTRGERRKLTFKRIRRNYKLNSVYGKKGNYLTEKEQSQPHRLYKGKNYNNRGGFSFRSGHLPPSKRDQLNEIKSKEMMDENDQEPYDEF